MPNQEPQAIAVTDERKAFMKGEGFVMFNDMSRRVLEHMAGLPVTPITRETCDDLYTNMGKGVYDSTTGLRNVMLHLARGVPTVDESRDRRAVFFKLRAGDRQTAAKYTFGEGTNDHEFTWYFSAAVATAAVHSFVAAKKIAPEQADQLTLSDWADVIGTGWFSTLIHGLALTGNGVWRDFGRKPEHYKPGVIRTHPLMHKDANPGLITGKPHFVVKEQLESEENNVYLTAVLHPDYKAALRQLRQRYVHGGSGGGSVGCPVARRAASLSVADVYDMPRVWDLRSAGYLEIYDEGNTMTVTQEWSAIDRTLSFIAAQLRHYDHRYGTPRFSGHRSKIFRHENPPKSEDVLFWPSGEVACTES